MLNGLPPKQALRLTLTISTWFNVDGKHGDSGLCIVHKSVLQERSSLARQSVQKIEEAAAAKLKHSIGMTMELMDGVYLNWSSQFDLCYCLYSHSLIFVIVFTRRVPLKIETLATYAAASIIG